MDDITEIPPASRDALGRSLGRFALGETGEGRIVQQLRQRASKWDLCPHYLDAVALFIAEEGRHAATLRSAARALGVPPPARSWSASGFTWARNLAGPGPKLLVLLAAEVVALSAYEVLSKRLPIGALRRALEQIASDERVHLRFHLDFLRSRVASATGRTALANGWRPLAIAAATVGITDHHRTLATLGIPARRVWQRCAETIDATARALQDPRVPRTGARRGALGRWVPMAADTHWPFAA